MFHMFEMRPDKIEVWHFIFEVWHFNFEVWHFISEVWHFISEARAGVDTALGPRERLPQDVNFNKPGIENGFIDSLMAEHPHQMLFMCFFTSNHTFKPAPAHTFNKISNQSGTANYWLPLILASPIIGFPYYWLPLLLVSLIIGFLYYWLPLLLASPHYWRAL